MLRVLLVEEQTSPYKLELAVYAPDAVGTAVGLMVRRPKLGQRAMVKDARERSEDPAVRDNENGLGITL